MNQSDQGSVSPTMSSFPLLHQPTQDSLTLEEIYSHLEVPEGEDLLDVTSNLSECFSISTLSLLLEPITEEEESLVKKMPVAITRLVDENWNEIMTQQPSLLSTTSSVTLNSPVDTGLLSAKRKEFSEMDTPPAKHVNTGHSMLRESLASINTNVARETTPLSSALSLCEDFQLLSTTLAEEISKINFNDVTVQELKNVLRKLGLRSTGKKHVLVSRLLSEKRRLATEFAFHQSLEGQSNDIEWSHLLQL
jgi:hypothetical protein